MKFLVAARPGAQVIPPEQVPMLTGGRESVVRPAPGPFGGIRQLRWRGRIWNLQCKQAKRSCGERSGRCRSFRSGQVSVDVVWEGKNGFDLFADVVRTMMSQMSEGTPSG